MTRIGAPMAPVVRRRSAIGADWYRAIVAANRPAANITASSTVLSPSGSAIGAPYGRRELRRSEQSRLLQCETQVVGMRRGGHRVSQAHQAVLEQLEEAL